MRENLKQFLDSIHFQDKHYWHHLEYSPVLKIKKHGSGDWPTKGKRKFEIGKYILHQQSGAPHKILILEEIIFEDGNKQIRLGYYIKGKKKRMKGKWVWGQYAPLIPKKDFYKIIAKAKKEKIL